MVARKPITIRRDSQCTGDTRNAWRLYTVEEEKVEAVASVEAVDKVEVVRSEFLFGIMDSMV